MNKKAKRISIISVCIIIAIIIIWAITASILVYINTHQGEWSSNPQVRVGSHTLTLPFDVSEQISQGSRASFKCSLTMDEMQELIDEMASTITEKEIVSGSTRLKIIVTIGECRYMYAITQKEGYFVVSSLYTYAMD